MESRRVPGRTWCARAKNPALPTPNRRVPGSDHLSDAVPSPVRINAAQSWAYQGSVGRRAGVFAPEPEWAKCALFVRSNAQRVYHAAQTHAPIQPEQSSCMNCSIRRKTESIFSYLRKSNPSALKTAPCDCRTVG